MIPNEPKQALDHFHALPHLNIHLRFHLLARLHARSATACIKDQKSRSHLPRKWLCATVPQAYLLGVRREVPGLPESQLCNPFSIWLPSTLYQISTRLAIAKSHLDAGGS